jgi:hypothetical protein
MLGTGNVGEYLAPLGEGDTFITDDGGFTWRHVMKGNYLWEYGDQGSIIVIVKWNEPTNVLHYSLDEGRNWVDYKFAAKNHTITKITTVPSDTSFNFLLLSSTRTGELRASINVDFSGVFDGKKCKFDVDTVGTGKSDYKLWEPRHPNQKDGCLFGHIKRYYRKKPGRKCANDRLNQLLLHHSIAKNCTCTRNDFECEYNYERQSHRSCRLIKGLEKPDPKQICYDDKNAFKYYDITGYRRIPLTTCQKGKQFDKVGPPHPCPGKQDEFNEKEGTSLVAVFFAVVIPIAAAGGIGYYVWQHWDGKFGRIRLGDTDSAGSVFDRDSPWVQWPVAAISGLVAVIAAVPMLIGLVWRGLTSRYGGFSGRTYNSRSSFARGRSGYAVVDTDEGGLLGDESEEEGW